MIIDYILSVLVLWLIVRIFIMKYDIEKLENNLDNTITILQDHLLSNKKR